MLFKIGVLKKFYNIHRKAPVLGSLFNKVADFIKKRSKTSFLVITQLFISLHNHCLYLLSAGNFFMILEILHTIIYLHSNVKCQSTYAKIFLTYRVSMVTM